PQGPAVVSEGTVLVIVTGDGRCYAEAKIPNACDLAALGMPVCLPSVPRPDRCWSGAGVKRFLAGGRPNPADVFGRVKSVVDRFLDFGRSLAPQETACEMVACYVLGTYLLDAFHVVGYLWPNGDAGTGKTTLLQVVAEMAYLGELLLAGSSYA